MSEVQPLQPGATRAPANQSESSAHLGRGAGLQEEGGSNQVSAYCKELLMRGGEEFSFEELRAERLNLLTQQQLDERLRRLAEVKEQLSEELELKRRELLLRRSQQAQEASDSASTFHIYESPSAAARPAGKSPNELLDDVFLRPDERGLCLQVQCPPTGHQRGTAEDLQTPDSVSQRPASKPRKKLSPIQETSSLSAGNCSLLQEDQDRDRDRDQDQDQDWDRDRDRDQDQDQAGGGGAVDPCDLELRRRLLDLSDVTSSPDFHSESGPLPVVEECVCVQLGGASYHIYCRVLRRGGVSVYKGASEDGFVVLAVDGGGVPWDFHQFLRLRSSSPAAERLPLVSCYLFQDGCITVYTTPPKHVFTELTECVSSEASVGYKAVSLLRLVSQLHSCRLLHAALQPHVLTCCHSGSLPIPDWVFPVDWSSSVDLDLQRDVTAAWQLAAAQTYISLGLLQPDAPPQLVDLLGLAETVHLLLTGSRMVPVQDGGGWTAKRFCGGELSDASFSDDVWTTFFRSLLNAADRPPASVLSELTELLAALYR